MITIMKKYSTGFIIRTGSALLVLALFTSCSIFQTEDDYSLSAFDNNVSAGLLDNIYTARMDTVRLSVLESTDSSWTDIRVDSLMTVSPDRDSIIANVHASGAIMIPGDTKQRLFSSAAYNSGYAILDMGAEAITENMVFFMSNHVTITIWNMAGDLVELQSDMFPSGMMVVSNNTKARYEYDLDPIIYLIRFTKAETLIDNAVKEFDLVLLNEDAAASTTADKVCGIMGGKTGSELQLFNYVELDTDWVDKDISYLYSVDTLRQALITALDANGVELDHSDFEQLIMAESLDETCFILDLTDYSVMDAGFYLDDYYDIQVLSAVDSAEVVPDYQGITFSEAGACFTLRQRMQFNLAAQKYIVVLTKFSGAPMRSKTKLVILDED